MKGHEYLKYFKGREEELFLKNIEEQKKDTQEYLNNFFICWEEFICKAFVWNKTHWMQGYSYWDRVYHRKIRQTIIYKQSIKNKKK